MGEYRDHLIARHDETDKDLDAMIAELQDTSASPRVVNPNASDEWLCEYIHVRQHQSRDWDAGHDRADLEAFAPAEERALIEAALASIRATRQA